jgi:hypothetical protein
MLEITLLCRGPSIGFIDIYCYEDDYYYYLRSWDKAVGIVTKGCMAEVSEFKFRLGKEFSLLHSIQTGSPAHKAYYPMDTRDSFPRWRS